MIRLLYIGNDLKQSKTNTSYMSVLGPLLEKEDYQLQYASNKVNKISRLTEMLWATFKLRNRVDVVLIDTYSTLNFYYAFAVSQLCRLFNLKYIPILHGGQLPQRLNRSPRLSKALFQHAYCNAAPSKYLLDIFREHGFLNIRHIPNTVAISDFKFEKKSFETPRLLWLRSFSKIYNPFMTIEVVKLLKDRDYLVELCMVGPDTDGSQLACKRLAEAYGLQVTFTGKLTKHEWVALSKDCNIFINTSNIDNMPLSLIEAMALGLPVVSTNVGGIPFLIDDSKNGLLVEANDPMAMSEAIERLLQNPELAQKLATNARAKVELFDWEHVKLEWKQLLSN